jgi:hypothetical protein
VSAGERLRLEALLEQNDIRNPKPLFARAP